LAKLLRENYYIVNRSGSGTVTHLAPELFQVCAQWDPTRTRRTCARGAALWAGESAHCLGWGSACMRSELRVLCSTPVTSWSCCVVASCVVRRAAAWPRLK